MHIFWFYSGLWFCEAFVHCNRQSFAKAAQDGPVFVTDGGRPAHVLLSIADYLRLVNKGPSIVELLSMPAAADIELEPPKVNFELKPADFS